MSHGRKVAVIGLGYVGLPVAVEMGKIGNCLGFDINRERILELQRGEDSTLEITADELKQTSCRYTDKIEDLKLCDFYIVAVPTPVDGANRPDLTALIRASEGVGKVLKQGDIVVYESTVYPGCTEEDCLPVLEKISGLKGGEDFKVGYSPERINPGDKEHTLTKIKKIVSAQDSSSLEIVAKVYGELVKAGIHKASSIKVAEAAKVIENTQRDLNIALMNELAIIFDRMGIDTQDVLEAAGTKWNFLKFTPGLVGGHCIGVDPYYLTHKAEQLGYHPQVILSGRKINDSMGPFIAQKTIKKLIKQGQAVQGAIVTILGATFKENCPDIRNSKVHDIIEELMDYGVKIYLSDPWADSLTVEKSFGMPLTSFENLPCAHAIILAVSHKQYLTLDSKSYKKIIQENGVVIDVKAVLGSQIAKELNLQYWRL